MNKIMSTKGVCRTALASPGVLKTCKAEDAEGKQNKTCVGRNKVNKEQNCQNDQGMLHEILKPWVAGRDLK